MKLNQIPRIRHIDSGNFFLLAGPCAIEGEDMALRIAEQVAGLADRLEIPYVFKGSFKKANRSRIDSFTGIGDEKALKILQKVGKTFELPVSLASASVACEVSSPAAMVSKIRVLMVDSGERGRPWYRRQRRWQPAPPLAMIAGTNQ